MEELKINEIIDLFKKANFHIDLCMGRSNGKHEFSKINKAMKQIPDLLEELKKYRVKEEQELLLRLPCHAGDSVYRINPCAMDPIIEMIVKTIVIRHHATSGKSFCLFCEDLKDSNESYYLEKAFGNDVFFTREEAEAALKKIQEGE